jgi:hypothetical protein
MQAINAWVSQNWRHIAMAIVVGVLAADQAVPFIPPATMHMLVAIASCLGLYSSSTSYSK